MNMRKNNFAVRVLEQPPQRGCGTSSQGIPKPPGHYPWQPALGDPASAEKLDKMIPRGSSQPPQVSDSVIDLEASSSTSPAKSIRFLEKQNL